MIALALSLALAPTPLWQAEFALVGYGCAGSSAPLYRMAEDEFPDCRAIERIPLRLLPPCIRAKLMPTDINVEACFGPRED